MFLKKSFLVFLFISSLILNAFSQTSADYFTIYLVRHAEKDSAVESATNPPLSECGELRSDRFAQYFNSINIDAIYSTDYTRTKSTAQPTADSKSLSVIIYNPRDLEAFAAQLRQQKQDALIVGHSNTTPQLAGILLGKDLDFIPDDVYDRIYKIKIYKNKEEFHIYQSSFKCNQE